MVAEAGFEPTTFGLVMSHKKKTFNQKGGVAKSTTSYNFAACLSDAGKRVLLVDSPPGHSDNSLRNRPAG